MSAPDRRYEKAYLQRMKEKIEVIAHEIGGDAKAIMDNHESCATLLLSEKDAEQLLRICGAKPLPENRRPSKAEDTAEWSRRCDLLSLRVRRAIGCGHSGFRTPDQLHQASIYFLFEEYLDQTAEKLGVGKEQSSSLAEILQ